MTPAPPTSPAAAGDPARAPSEVIDRLVTADWPAVARIYADGLATGTATFETAVPVRGAWDRAHLPDPRLACRRRGELVGFATLSAVSPRPAYAGVAEDSVYVASTARGSGVGRRLLAALVTASEGAGIWTLQASVFPENTASLRVHVACGFRVVGTRQRIGRLDGRWRDVVLLERRSQRTGTVDAT